VSRLTFDAEELLAQFPARRADLFRGVSLGAQRRLENALVGSGSAWRRRAVSAWLPG
jgi:hypothetical protein